MDAGPNSERIPESEEADRIAFCAADPSAAISSEDFPVPKAATEAVCSFEAGFTNDCLISEVLKLDGGDDGCVGGNGSTDSVSPTVFRTEFRLS